MVSILQFITVILIPLTVLACEGECISGTAKEYLKRYSSPIHRALHNTAHKIAIQCVPPENRPQDPMIYMEPVLHAFNKVAFHGLEHAIFPSYFHGKCLYPNGTVPHGCPNPDCPVVCGTPGSMVHFFPTLTQIVFDYMSAQLANVTSLESKAYRQVEKLVLADTYNARRALPRTLRSAKLQARRATATEARRLRAIVNELPMVMLKTCGGWNLSRCTWETHMKKFILQYP